MFGTQKILYKDQNSKSGILTVYGYRRQKSITLEITIKGIKTHDLPGSMRLSGICNEGTESALKSITWSTDSRLRKET